MKRLRFTFYGSLFILLLLAVGVTAARAQTGTSTEYTLSTAEGLSAGYSLTWWTVDGGGAVGAGSPGPYTLNGTAGQPDAGVLSGGGYVLAGGFWPGVAVGYRIYLPLVLRAYP